MKYETTGLLSLRNNADKPRLFHRSPPENPNAMLLKLAARSAKSCSRNPRILQQVWDSRVPVSAFSFGRCKDNEASFRRDPF